MCKYIENTTNFILNYLYDEKKVLFEDNNYEYYENATAKDLTAFARLEKANSVPLYDCEVHKSQINLFVDLIKRRVKNGTLQTRAR
jgi:hypothetical protein